MKAISGVLLGLALLSLPGCQVVQGSGNKKTEARTVGSFSKVQVRGAADVVVVAGGKSSIEVTTDDNLLKQIETRVEGDTLIIETKGSMRSSIGFNVAIATPRLSGAAISGSGAVTVESVDEQSFEASIAGSGNMTVSGKAARISASISGSGEMNLANLSARRAKASIAGSGDIDLNVSDELEASISGSGDISYSGNPRVQKSIAGSGNIGQR